MGHRARGRHATTTAALLAATVTVTLAAGCAGGPRTPVDDGRGRPVGTPALPSPNTPTPQRPATAPAPLAVKIDNVRAARPQTGLRAADVVYAEQVEGGLSRLMAVFATKLPKVVGPVRSARESDLELLRQYDRPTLAFSGAQHKLLPLIGQARLRPEQPGNVEGAFFRNSDKSAPHNLYLRPARLMPTAPTSAALTNGFRFGAAPDGGTPQTTRTVRYPSASFTFDWSAERGRWLVSTDGSPTVTSDGQRVTPATVVVQYVKMRSSRFHDFLGNTTPYTETVGSGTADVLRDGRVYGVKWKRPRAADGTDFTTAAGQPVNFADGQVWVVFARAS
ncbi:MULTISPECIES: DUF3048 domain-containing protein [unclassified Streptomyces]|uniref:DUF3048 domain-containing protein n=2 Tax=Streptomyces TaxID=1883 RepID=A0ABD5EI79_9ACTN|nr:MULTISPECIES: DUF3048 domain-containing protein [unclassified Streptomyces]MDT0433117.1 DUF3048 domain-containing protein [Streptomyces sp. DSM 41981]MYQ66352.1 DUF3048 domain-containing protein [Streptomyces sp. SID4950]